MFQETAERLNPDNWETHHPLPGAEKPWDLWLGDVAPDINVSLMAPEHRAMWVWIDSLVPGVAPVALFLDWPRDFGKTTSMRLAMARLATTITRRFGLYVCSTQEAANNHIVSIRTHFETLGMVRAESKYGHALGWSGERLRTDNGFTVIALGLDTASIRGLNLDTLRPDFIVFDDIDELSDSVGNIDKKKATITQTVIPAGSQDCAYIFGQNEIHPNSIMHWFVSGEADALRNRKILKTVAVEGFQCGTRPGDSVGDPDRYVITAGTSTWPGKSLSDWEITLNKMGDMAFRRECQHELGAGGLFFRFSPFVIVPDTGEKRPWHVCPMPKYEAWWDTWAAGDYGTQAPACYPVAVSDQWGVVTVIGEEYAADRTSKQQSLGLLLLCYELGVGSKPPAERKEFDDNGDKVPGGIVYTDKDGEEKPVETRLDRLMMDWASTFPPMAEGHQTAIQRQGEYPVEVMWRYGIPATPAVKDVIAGLRNMVDWLARTVTYPKDHPTEPGRTVPAFRLAEGVCPMLEGYLTKALKHPKDPRLAVAPAKFEHAGDAGRYLLMARAEASDHPKAAEPEMADWVKRELGIEEKVRRF